MMNITSLQKSFNLFFTLIADISRIIILKDNADCDSICASLAYKLLYEQCYQKPIKLTNIEQIPEIAKKIIQLVGLELPKEDTKVHITTKDIPNTGRIYFKKDMPIRSAISQYYKSNQLDYIVVDNKGKYQGVIQLKNLLKTFMLQPEREHMNRVNLEFDYFVQTIEGTIIKTKEQDLLKIKEYEQAGLMKNYDVLIPTTQLDCFQYMTETHTEEQMQHSIAIVGHNVEVINDLIKRKCGIIVLTKSCINVNNNQNKMHRISSNEKFDFESNVLIEDDLSVLYDGNEQFKQILTQEGNESLIIQSRFTSSVITNLMKYCLSIQNIMDKSLKYTYDSNQPLSGLKFDNNIHCFAIVDKNMKVLNHVERIDLVNLKLLNVTLIGHQSLSYINRYLDINHIVLDTVLDRHLISSTSISGAQYIRIKPVGSVCTLVYFHFNTKVNISSQIAYLLLNGILLDTLNLKSEKTTQDDKIAVQQLLKLVEIEQQDIFTWLMQNSFNLTNENKYQLLVADYKIFNYRIKQNIYEYSLSSIEVDSLDDLNQDCVQDILGALSSFVYRYNLDFGGLFITNATTNESILILSDFQDLYKIQNKLQIYDKNIPNAFALPGVTSRTKTVVPMLNKILEQ